MKILILDTDYPAFVNTFYAARPDLREAAFETQIQALEESCFATIGIYQRHFRRLGLEANEVHMDIEPLQKAWAKVHGVTWREEKGVRLSRRGGLVPWPRFYRNSYWFEDIVRAQIRHFSPDLIYLQDLHALSPALLREIRKEVKYFVGQIASAIPEDLPCECFDLIFSSLPNLVARLRGMGAKAEFSRLAFERTLVEKIPVAVQDIPVAFVGTLGPDHSARVEFLRRLATEVDLHLWGPGMEGFSSTDPLRKAYRGPAWGRGMYEVFRRSKLVLNFHLDLAGPHANNMRLYEATGMGAALVTDWKADLHEIFEPEQEVITYRGFEECLAKIKFYLEHEDKRQAIARAGQQRVLRDHTYDLRLQEVKAILLSRLPAVKTARAV